MKNNYIFVIIDIIITKIGSIINIIDEKDIRVLLCILFVVITIFLSNKEDEYKLMGDKNEEFKH